jgi:hypothetical protein
MATKTSAHKHVEPLSTSHIPVVSSCEFTTETIGENRRQRSNRRTRRPCSSQRDKEQGRMVGSWSQRRRLLLDSSPAGEGAVHRRTWLPGRLVPPTEERAWADAGRWGVRSGESGCSSIRPIQEKELHHGVGLQGISTRRQCDISRRMLLLEEELRGGGDRELGVGPGAECRVLADGSSTGVAPLDMADLLWLADLCSGHLYCPDVELLLRLYISSSARATSPADTALPRPHRTQQGIGNSDSFLLFIFQI